MTRPTSHRRTVAGPGWTVAVRAPKANAKGTLYLIDPAGHRRAVAAVPANAGPQLWSPTGERVLVSAGSGSYEVTLADGRLRRLALPTDASPVAYSRPHGLAVLAALEVKHGGYYVTRLERFGRDGRHQLTYPDSIPGAGRIDTQHAIETGDGTELVLGADRGRVRVRNDGTPGRRLLTAGHDCTTSTWWGRDVALADCGGVLWSVPTSGAAPTRLTAPAAQPNSFGYSALWRSAAGRFGLAPNGCGPQSLVRFDAHGTGHRFDVPQPIARPGRPVYVGHHGTVIEMTVSPGAGCMSGPRTLFAYDAANGRSTALLGPGVDGGTVTGAITYPAD